MGFLNGKAKPDGWGAEPGSAWYNHNRQIKQRILDREQARAQHRADADAVERLLRERTRIEPVTSPLQAFADKVRGLFREKEVQPEVNLRPVRRRLDGSRQP